MMPDPISSACSPVFQRIASLFRVLVAAVAISFCYFASSLCITIILASFLAILIDPVVEYLARVRVPRSVSSALLILAGMAGIGFLAYGSYNRVNTLVEELPTYADRLRQLAAPINQKLAKVEESAGRLNPEPPAKKIAEVKLREGPTWPSYLVRGFGSVSSVIVVLVFVPFLMYFILVKKEKWYSNAALVLGPSTEPAIFSKRLAELVRGFAVGNLVVGMLMAGVTVVILYMFGIHGAVVIGVVSGFLNLIPFLGAILAALAPVAVAFGQGLDPKSLVIIAVSIIVLHVVASNLLMPRLIGSRMNVGPVAASVGILFWGWLWGVFGVLLAIPLTGMIKLIADGHPSLIHLSNLLGEAPPPSHRAAARPAPVPDAGLVDDAVLDASKSG